MAACAALQVLEDADDKDVYRNEPLILSAPLSVLAKESSVTACAALGKRGILCTELSYLPEDADDKDVLRNEPLSPPALSSLDTVLLRGFL